MADEETRTAERAVDGGGPEARRALAQIALRDQKGFLLLFPESTFQATPDVGAVSVVVTVGSGPRAPQRKSTAAALTGLGDLVDLRRTIGNPMAVLVDLERSLGMAGGANPWVMNVVACPDGWKEPEPGAGAPLPPQLWRTFPSEYGSVQGLGHGLGDYVQVPDGQEAYENFGMTDFAQPGPDYAVPMQVPTSMAGRVGMLGGIGLGMIGQGLTTTQTGTGNMTVTQTDADAEEEPAAPDPLLMIANEVARDVGTGMSVRQAGVAAAARALGVDEATAGRVVDGLQEFARGPILESPLLRQFMAMTAGGAASFDPAALMSAVQAAASGPGMEPLADLVGARMRRVPGRRRGRGATPAQAVALAQAAAAMQQAQRPRATRAGRVVPPQEAAAAWSAHVADREASSRRGRTTAAAATPKKARAAKPKAKPKKK